MPALLRLLALPLVCLLIGPGCGHDGADDPATAPDPATLPLLAAGQRVGIIYSAPAPAARATLDAAFAECIASGVDSYELAVAWSDLESSPGVVDLATLDGLLTTIQSSGLVPYLVLRTIDTVTLNLPADLADPLDGAAFRTGLGFDHPTVLARFASLLDQLVPLLVQRGGFYLSVGNEVDIWLGSRPAEVAAYATFVRAARDRAHALEPRLAVGATATFAAITDAPSLFAAVHAASDIVALTYYPLAADFSVRSPADVATDVAVMRAAVLPGPLLLQEVGYPAGWTAGATNGSSHELQRQFVENMFIALAGDPTIRFASFLHLADWTDSELDTFEQYYGTSLPLFREYLGTLGLRESADGAAKPAYTEFLDGLDRL